MCPLITWPILAFLPRAYGFWRHQEPRWVVGCLPCAQRASQTEAATRTRMASASASEPALMTSAAKAARVAEAGIVKTQAHTIRRATPHRTALNRRVAPTPITEPDTT